MKISYRSSKPHGHSAWCHHLSIAIYAYLMKERWFELKAYVTAVWDETYLEAASTTSYSAIPHFWVSVHISFKNNCIMIYSFAVLQWFCSFSIWNSSSYSFFLLCSPDRCSSTNPWNFSNQSLALGLSTRLLLTKSFWCGIMSSPVSSSLSVLLA